MASATGIGPMPGDDVVETFKVVLGEMPELPFLPVLPARGVHAGGLARSLALIADLGVDLQPDGWRIGVGQGVDQRRARSLLAQDLDLVEELAHELEGQLKVQVTGPLTLAARVEHPRGDKVLADHGARRELTEAFTIGLETHLADLHHRFPTADLLVQVDEPALRSVLDGAVPTASGYRRHRSLEPSEVDAHLQPVTRAIRGQAGVAVAHVAGPDVPVGLLRGAGFMGVVFELERHAPDDRFGEALDQGGDLWVRTAVDDGAAVRVQRFFGALGFEPETIADRVVVTGPGGLADLTPADARATLSATAALARRLGGDRTR